MKTSVELGFYRHLQCVCQTAFGQLDFESVLTLWFGIAHGRFRRFSEAGFVRRLSHKSRFGFLGPPRLGPDTTQSDPSAANASSRNGDDDCRGCESEFIRRPVAQLEIKLLTPL